MPHDLGRETEKEPGNRCNVLGVIEVELLIVLRETESFFVEEILVCSEASLNNIRDFDKCTANMSFLGNSLKAIHHFHPFTSIHPVTFQCRSRVCIARRGVAANKHECRSNEGKWRKRS